MATTPNPTATPTIPARLLDDCPYEGSIYVDGEWRGAADLGYGRGLATVTEPATGAELGTIGIAAVSDVAAAAAAAQIAQRQWAARSFTERAAVMRRAAGLLEWYAGEASEWLVRESGSARPKASIEVELTLQEFNEAATLPSRELGQVLPTAGPRISLSRRVPVGVVGVIAPYNFPLVLAGRSVAPALALGNAVILKPDPRTAISGGVILARIFELAGLPAGLLQVLPGGTAVGEALVDDPRVPVVSFTGSTAAGRAVAEAGARRLKKVHLELGGNSALIVCDDVEDLDLAARAAAWASFWHQGQICMATGRILVHERIADDFVARLAAIAGKLTVGDPAEDNVDLGPLIDAPHRDRVHGLVQDSVAGGARLVAGGTYDGLFYRPTVLTDVNIHTPAYAREVFGPVASIIACKDLEDAVDLAASDPYGLALGFLTGNPMRAWELAQQVDVGIVHIGDQTIDAEAVAPFGGMRASGNGSRIGGAAANVDAFTEPQWATLNYGDTPPYPYSAA